MEAVPGMEKEEHEHDPLASFKLIHKQYTIFPSEQGDKDEERR